MQFKMISHEFSVYAYFYFVCKPILSCLEAAPLPSLSGKYFFTLICYE